MRIIGDRKNWSETELDPAAAYRRGRVLDAALRSAVPAPQRGVYRGTFEFFAHIDATRALAATRRLNRG